MPQNTSIHPGDRASGPLHLLLLPAGTSAGPNTVWLRSPSLMCSSLPPSHDSPSLRRCLVTGLSPPPALAVEPRAGEINRQTDNTTYFPPAWPSAGILQSSFPSETQSHSGVSPSHGAEAEAVSSGPVYTAFLLLCIPMSRIIHHTSANTQTSSNCLSKGNQKKI